MCPHLNRRVRKLYLPLGGRHFWSRRAYELAYASQRETKFDRALRRARKVRLRLGGDPAGDDYPDKPPRMRWTTYNRLMDNLRLSGTKTVGLMARRRALFHKACWVNGSVPDGVWPDGSIQNDSGLPQGLVRASGTS